VIMGLATEPLRPVDPRYPEKRSLAKKKPAGRSKRRAHRPVPSNTVALRSLPTGGGWILVHPRCARDRAEDIDEVREMIDVGEYDVAQDELRWLLSGCTDCLDAHLLLGELAIEAHHDLNLARGHLGYAYQLGLRAWRRAGRPVPVPCAQPANRGFHEAGRHLAWCLEKLGKPTMADEIVETLLVLDPTDPLELRQMLAKLRGGGDLPIL